MLLILLISFWSSDCQSENIGFLAPDFTLNDLYGMKIALSQFKGKVVILNFWSIWCGPCLAEMPSLNRLYLEFKDKGLVVLAIAEDPAEKPLRAYVKDKGLAFPVLMDKDRKVYFKYALFGIPVSFLIDKKGVIVEKFIGESDWVSHQMKEKILILLKK
ncbi:MAG: TlpA family protein disulfide reductase [Nitrospirae bacterium]|nr:TlpA family protein disulfide reductase [Nitrospirota bacterium]